MKTSSTGNIPFPCLSLPPSSEVTPDLDAQTLRSCATERQARHQAERAHEEKLRQRGARIQAANEAVSAYMRESGTRDYQRAFGYIQRTRPELFAQGQVPAHFRTVANSSEQARQEMRHRRWERIQAANDAVDDYMRESGTRDYSAAFNHIVRTRPDLFAGMQDSSGLLAAANFNPYHDKLGRFTTSDDAVASGDKNGAEGGRDDGLDGQGGGQTKPASISGHAYDSRTFQTCVVASIRSLIATKHPDRVPSEDAIKAQLAAAAKGLFTKPQEGVDWDSYGVAAIPGHYGALVQQVLANNGVQSTFQPSYATMQQLSDALIRSGQPAMVNLQPEGGAGQHSVAVQWDADAADGAGRFLINNVNTKGYTDSVTKAQFESGQITSDLRDQGSIESRKPRRYRVNSSYAVVITR